MTFLAVVDLLTTPIFSGKMFEFSAAKSGILMHFAHFASNITESVSLKIFLFLAFNNARQ